MYPGIACPEGPKGPEGVPYFIVNDMEISRFTEWLSYQTVVGFDIETSGLHRKCEIKSIQIATDYTIFIYTDPALIAKALWELFYEAEDVTVAIHNAAFDMREVLYTMQEEVAFGCYQRFEERALSKVEDTQTMAQIIYGQQFFQFGLDFLVNKFVPDLAYGHDSMVKYYHEKTEITKAPTRTKLGEFTAEITREEWGTNPRCMAYSSTDAIASYRFWHMFDALMVETPMQKVRAIERELIPTVLQLNMAYMPISYKRATQLMIDLDAEMRAVQEEYDGKFLVDVSHPTRLQELAEADAPNNTQLAEALGKTPTGKWCLNAQALTKAAALDWGPAEGALKIRQYKKRIELLSKACFRWSALQQRTCLEPR